MRFLFTLPAWVTTVFAVAADANSKQPQWWEIITGILAVPAAVVGLIYSVLP